jgi:hypothetical protein
MSPDGKCSTLGDIAQMALILLMMSVSEVEAERLFSATRFIFGDRIRRTLQNLMDALLCEALGRLILESISPLVARPVHKLKRPRRQEAACERFSLRWTET